MKQYIRKADIILFAVLVCLGLALTAALALSEADGASDAQVVIKSGGKLFAAYSIGEEKSVRVPAPGDADDYNVVEIKGGSVTVTEASCKNQVCVKHNAISHVGESIICLPNRLVVSIEGGAEGGGYDSITS